MRLLRLETNMTVMQVDLRSNFHLKNVAGDVETVREGLSKLIDPESLPEVSPNPKPQTLIPKSQALNPKP